MATGSDSDFAKATNETTIEKFRHCKLLKHNYPSEIKSEEEFETLVYRLVLFFLSANIFWSTWKRSMKILLMSFIDEAVASIV